MKLPEPVGGKIHYRCNICGLTNTRELGEFHRELAPCTGCGANARFRGIVRALAECLQIPPGQALWDWPSDPGISGIGMSDWPGYAGFLAQKFSYLNTHYDRVPQLDVLNPAKEHLGRYDFLISTDVLEHVAQPLQRAFDNLFRLLKPGGHLVFSVPYSREAATVEHFEDLGDFEVHEFRGEKILINRLGPGRYAVHDNLVFHGGEGATLEMRVFCESDVLDRLGQAGFSEIKVHDQPDLSIGYYWPPGPGHTDPGAPLLYAYIITARRPA
jgi:SAM-dependent methyltransferase